MNGIFPSQSCIKAAAEETGLKSVSRKQSQQKEEVFVYGFWQGSRRKGKSQNDQESVFLKGSFLEGLKATRVGGGFFDTASLKQCVVGSLAGIRTPTEGIRILSATITPRGHRSR